MNQKFVKAFARVIAFILAVLLIISTFMVIPFGAEAQNESCSVYGAAVKSESDTLNKEDLQRLGAYMEYLHRSFKDTVDYDTLVNGAFDGVTKALGDKFSEYYANEEEENNFTTSVDGTFEGIGVVISEDTDGRCVINSLVPNGPATEAGLKEGDIITAVDGKSTTGLTVNEISQLLRGQKGTSVKVTVERNGNKMNFMVIRNTVNNTCLSYQMIDDNIGYIKMTGFDSDAGVEFRMAALSLTNKGAEKLIIDLRNNPGGFVEQALIISDLILEKGYISHFQIRGEIVESVSAKAVDKVYQPIVLLVNENTASSSEILAAALQDNDAATLVGTTTYGKGIAQQIVDIGDGKSAKVSTFYFLRPDKTMIQGIGITPDVVVENVKAAELAAAKEIYQSFAPMSEKEKPGLGAVGLNVYGAQQRLSLIGYDVTVTGTMDAKTVQAVKDFQKASGLYAYGVLDYTTANTLDKAAQEFANGQNVTDKQLEKAMEIAETL